MLNKGLLVVISGPSGVGKTTLCQKLVESEVGRLVVTCTSRAPRPGEKEGVHYFFLSREAFEKKIRAGEFIEHALVYGDYKGILKSEIDKGLAKGETLILNLDVQGAATIRSLFSEVLDVFVDVVETQQLRQRLELRCEDTPQEISRRLQEVEKEREYQKEFSHVVYNDDLKKCYQNLKHLIESYRKEHHVG